MSLKDKIDACFSEGQMEIQEIFCDYCDYQMSYKDGIAIINEYDEITIVCDVCFGECEIEDSDKVAHLRDL